MQSNIGKGLSVQVAELLEGTHKNVYTVLKKTANVIGALMGSSRAAQG